MLALLNQLDIRRMPQGGGIRLRVGRSLYDLRVQTQPSLLGENAGAEAAPAGGLAQPRAGSGSSLA